jgi:hypothetical protein
LVGALVADGGERLACFIHEEWLFFASAPGLEGYFPGRHEPFHIWGLREKHPADSTGPRNSLARH